MLIQTDAIVSSVIDKETKEKLRQANLGKNHSQETCKRMSESKSGDKNHFYGKTHSEETKEKMKLARSKQIITEETKEKMRLAWQKRKLEKSSPTA